MIEIEILKFLHDHFDKYFIKVNNIETHLFFIGSLKSIHWVLFLKQLKILTHELNEMLEKYYVEFKESNEF